MKYKGREINKVYLHTLDSQDSGYKYSITNDILQDELDKMLLELEHYYCKKDKELAIYIPIENARFYKTHRAILCCVYDAVTEYMQAILGTKLCIDDKEWYKELAVVETGGLPYEHTLTVINELVRPYGLGISRVYLPKKTSTSKEMKEWAKYLGVNPAARVNRDCTNEEYVNLVAPAPGDYRNTVLEEIKGYNLEHVETFPKPAIVFAGKDKGGHASYESPRGNTSDIAMALRIDRLERIKYHVDPPEVKLATYVNDDHLNLWECIAPDGKTFAVKYEREKTYFKSSRETKNWNFPSSWNPYFSEENCALPSPTTSKLIKEKGIEDTQRRVPDLFSDGSLDWPVWRNDLIKSIDDFITEYSIKEYLINWPFAQEQGIVKAEVTFGGELTFILESFDLLLDRYSTSLKDWQRTQLRNILGSSQERKFLRDYVLEQLPLKTNA